MSISALGSVYGKKLGRSRTFTSPNSSRSIASNVPFRSASVMPSPTTSPSNCWNIGVWLRSRLSRRYTRPGTMMRTGGGNVFM